MTCYNWENVSGKDVSLTLKQIERISRSINRPMMHVLLTGGEPFLRRDLPELVEVFHHYSPIESLSITTNGSMPRLIERTTLRLLERFPNPVSINLSMDGVGEAHDHIRGVTGSYSAIKETYKRLVTINSPRIKLTANTVLCRQTLAGLKHLHQVILDEFPAISVHTISPLFGTPWDKSIEPLSREELKDALPLLTKVVEDSDRYPLNSPTNLLRKAVLAAKLSFNERWLEGLQQGKARFYPCKAGRTLAHIDCHGNLHTCVDSCRSVSLENHDWDVMRAWRSPEFKEHLEKIAEDGCECASSGTDTTNTFFTPLAYPLLIRNFTRLIMRKSSANQRTK